LSVSLTLDQLLRLRARAQQLDADRALAGEQAGAIVQRVCGVQAQDAPAAALSLRVRSAALTARQLESAVRDDRTVVRTWAMRGTLHLIATADFGWLMPLVGPVFIAANRRRRSQLGLDDDTCAAGVRALRAALLARGPLSRAELVVELTSRGLLLREGQAVPHLLAYAALSGVICYGPERNGRPVYALTERWLDPGTILPRAEALAQLAPRYLDAYGPAGPADLAAWSGLPAADVRQAWRAVGKGFIELTVEGHSGWMPEGHAAWLDEAPSPTPLVRLLPRFDTYLLGYKGRDAAVATEHGNRVNAGGGIVHPTLLVDGRVLGLWSLRKARGAAEVTVQPFSELPPGVAEGIHAEIADIGRFLDLPAGGRTATPS
jgi:hypothetical protein